MSRVPQQWNRPSVLGVTGTILCLAGCQLTAGPVSSPSANGANNLAAGVTVVAAPARRLLVTAGEDQNGSRLLALWVRIENTGNEPLAFNPENVVLTFADRSATVPFDRERANLLIERLDVAPTEEAAAEYVDEWALARRAGQQPILKRQLRDDLLAERLLGTEVVEGYLLFDTKQRTSSLDGALLEILLVRDSDQTMQRQVYHFANAPPPAAQTE